MQGIARDTMVDGRYRIIDRIGSGGMADVYCAEDTQLGRKVALKLLYRRFAEDDEFVERFRREASSAAGLQHPNVVQVFDRGEWDGTYYIAMEFLEGRTLKQVVREHGALDPALAVDLVIQILKAARFAHRRGIVHRDIKPHNVIVDDEGRAKVTDFGIARAGASDMTETGSIMGTAQYLSPEQAQGHPVDARSDLYSIGIVLYELLTGTLPFDAESAVTIALKQVSEAPIPPTAAQPGGAAGARRGRAARAAQGPGRALPGRRRVHRRARARAGRLRRAGRWIRSRCSRRRTGGSWGRIAAIALVVLALAALAVGAYLLLAPEQTTVPDVVGKRTERGDAAAAGPRLRGRDRPDPVRHRRGGPRRRPEPGAGRGGRRGLDGHDHRLQRARRGAGPARAGPAGRRGGRPAARGGLPHRAAARVLRHGAQRAA